MELYFTRRKEWRKWLEKNHLTCEEVWLRYYKKPSGLPRIQDITGSLPEIKMLVDEYKCGIKIPEITASEISKAIIKLSDNRSLLNKLKQNPVYASETLTWENESKKVIEFYKQIISKQ